MSKKRTRRRDDPVLSANQLPDISEPVEWQIITLEEPRRKRARGPLHDPVRHPNQLPDSYETVVQINASGRRISKRIYAPPCNPCAGTPHKQFERDKGKQTLRNYHHRQY